MAVPLKGLAPPSNLVASNITQTSLQLNWKDNSSNEKWFDIYLSTDGVNWTFYSPSINKNTTIAQITGLKPGILYSFKVAAANGSKAAYSTPIQAATLPPTPIPPKSITVGDYYVKSYFAVSNSRSQSAFLVADLYGVSVFAVVYDRSGTINVIPLPGLPGIKASLSGECQWANDTRLICVTTSNVGMLEVWEYDISGSSAMLVNSFETGDGYCRWNDILKLPDGTLLAVSYEQAGGIEGWFVQRNPDGTWVNYGRQVFVASDPMGEPAGIIRLAQRPDGTLWGFAVKDSWGILNATEFSLNPFKVITNINNILPLSTGFGDKPDISINGELPEFFKIVTDGDSLLFSYPNEQLISITTPPYAIRVAKVAVTAWNADNTTTLLETTPGYTERAQGNFALNMVNGAPSLCYVSLAYANGSVPNLLTRFYQRAEQVLLSIDHWNNVVENKDFNDVVAKDLSGVMQIILLLGDEATAVT